MYYFLCLSDHVKFWYDGIELGGVTPPDGGFYELGGFANQGIPNPWAGHTKMAPFDQEFFLILNIAVGGTNGFFPDGLSNPGGKPWTNTESVKETPNDSIV